MSDKKYDIKKIREYLQDCNINFLFGSGTSKPYLGTLGNIEKLLTELDDRNDIEKDKKEALRFFIYKKYFKIAMEGNISILNKENDNDLKETLNNYKNFINIINSLILKRGSSILNKQINIFTTNIDLFFEKAFEGCEVEFNDGFYGRLKPYYDLNRFKLLRKMVSHLYENLSEFPVFNLLKIHGSVNWIKNNNDEKIYYDLNIKLIKKLKKKLNSFKNLPSIDITNNDNIDSLIEKLPNLSDTTFKKIEEFIKLYKNLLVVNPTKEKFKDTVLNQKYYEILRIYANELEKENSVLFVIGFSFADEHIRDITVRALNANPTLTMFVFAYTKKAKEEIEAEINKSSYRNKNIFYLYPEDKKEFYNLKTINDKFFSKI